MWTKEMLKEMFPSGQLPPQPELPATVLLNSDFDTVTINESRMARHMVHSLSEIKWTDDGKKTINIEYDVYPFPKVNTTPCLSVYGGKMVREWLQSGDNFIVPFCNCPTKKQEENNNNVRFNYTGI